MQIQNLNQKSLFWLISTILVTEFIYSLGNLLILFILGFVLGNTTTSTPAVWTILFTLLALVMPTLGVFMGVKYIKKRALINTQTATKIAIGVLALNLIFYVLDLNIFNVAFNLAIFLIVKYLSVNSPSTENPVKN